MEKKPLHVFIIPDGNRRWAKEKGLAPWEGHKQGYEVLRSILKKIWPLGVTHFTFWGLSMDNFINRSPEEIMFIFHLFEKAVDELLIAPELKEERVRIRIIGKLKKAVENKIQEKIRKLEKDTVFYQNKNFTLLFGYNGNEELEEAVTMLITKSPPQQRYSYNNMRNWLWTRFLPDVDIMIRTGFEAHLSGAALLMQMANAHLYFPQCHWPDFSIKKLAEIIDDFKNRQRRFGA